MNVCVCVRVRVREGEILKKKDLRTQSLHTFASSLQGKGEKKASQLACVSKKN